jgi:Tfp pilus assembly protein PilZ
VKTNDSDRRVSRRLWLNTPMLVRVWKSAQPEERAVSLNISQSGVYFASDSPLREGETVEILLRMPEELTDEPSTDWRFTGHVVRVERVRTEPGRVGIGVQFDCYEVARAKQRVAEAVFAATAPKNTPASPPSRMNWRAWQ